MDWSSVPVPWLKAAVKNLARQQLTTATLSWGTLTQWVRATRQLAQFFTTDGTVPDPSAVTRSVLLDYLAWTRRSDTAADARLANTGAYLLESLHDTGLVPDLGSSMFLRRGENVHRKTRNPRPFPPDVIERIDTLIVDNPDTDPTLRVMIATTRWAGCPISGTGRTPTRLPAPLRRRALDRILDDQNLAPGAGSPSPTAWPPSSCSSRPAFETPTDPTPSTCFPAHDRTPPPAAPNPGPPAACDTASQPCSANTESPHRQSPASRSPAGTSTASGTPSG